MIATVKSNNSVLMFKLTVQTSNIKLNQQSVVRNKQSCDIAFVQI